MSSLGDEDGAGSAQNAQPRRGITHAAIWLGGGSAIRAAISIILPIFLVRSLSKTDYGLFKQIALAATLALPFITLGFDKSIVYFVPRRRLDAKEEVSTAQNVVFLNAAGLLIFGIFFPRAFGTLFGCAGITLLVLAAALTAASEGFYKLARGALVALDAPRIAGLWPAVTGVPRAISMAVAAVMTRSLPTVLIVVIVFELLHILLGLAFLRRLGVLSARIDRQTLKRHLRFGGVLAIGSIAQSWVSSLDRFMISSFLSPAAFAVYSVGRTNVPFVSLVANAVRTATAPRYSLLDAESRRREMAGLWSRSVEVLLPIYLVICTFFIVTARWFIPIVFTDAYRDSVPVFQVVSASMILHATAGSTEELLRGLGALRFLMTTIFVSLALKLILVSAALQVESLVLVALASLVVGLIIEVVRAIYIKARLRVPWSALAPRRGILLAIGLAVTGSVGTWLIGIWQKERAIPSLVLSSGLWALLVLAGAWQQGLVRKPPLRGQSR